MSIRGEGLPEGSDGTVDPKYQYDAILGTINFINELTGRPGNKGIVDGIFWYNIDPRGRGSEWECNHELKVSNYENGNFDRSFYPKKIYKLCGDKK